MEQVSKAVSRASSRWALAGLSLTMLMPSLATSTANIALPSLAQAFGASFQAVQWIVLSYLLTVTALIVAMGRLGDMLGRRQLLLVGITIFALGSLLSGVAPTLGLLIAARAVQGAGAAIMMVLTMALVGEIVPKERTGSVMGLLGTTSAVGTTLGPALGGVLIAWAGGKAIFLINVPLAILALVIVSYTLPKGPPRGAPRSTGFDIAGTGLLSVALTAYALAMTIGRGRYGTLNVAFLAAALAASLAFIIVEARASSPLVRLELFRERALAAGLSASTIVSAVMMATLIVGPFYLAKVIGLGPATAGLILAIGPLIAAVASAPAGRLVDRFGTDRAVIGGLAALLAGASALSVLPAAFGIAGYAMPIVCMTAGYGLFQAANNTAIMARANSAERGVISGLLSLSRNLGLVTGASAMGTVFAWGAAVRDVARAGARAVLTGLHATFAVAAVLIFISLLIALRTTHCAMRAGPCASG